MTTEHDPRTRIVLSWLHEDAHENAERYLLRALDEVDTTPQRQPWWPARRFPNMNTFAKLAIAATAVLVVAVAGFQLLPRTSTPGAQATATPPSASPSGETATADLVTEEVEPGVERIRSDGAGHDLEERHPTFRYDMDDVYVTPDGTVWLNSTYSDTDNEANPPGGLVWALGQSETSQYPAAVSCFPGDFDKPEVKGVTCYKTGTDIPTRYLADTQINAVAAAPDGTFWAVGGDGAENGGLYHITPE